MKESTTMKNETVAQAETVILIADIEQQIAAIARLLPAHMRRQIKAFEDTIHSDLETLGESIQKLSQPGLCARCRHTLTESLDQFEAHLQSAADRMLQLTASWPREHFVRRMREELVPGDEIIFLGVGRASVLRRDGSTEVIYQKAK